MALGQEYLSIPGLLAGSNLSGEQYKVVKLASTAGEVVLVAATSTLAIGILQNDPADGEPADVCTFGVCKGVVGPSDVAFGDVLGHDSTSRLKDHATDNLEIIAIALEANSGANDIIRIFVTGPGRY